MEKTPGTVEPSEDMVSPVLLNSLDFPPLIVPTRPDALSIASFSRSSVTKTVSSRVSSNKRPMRQEEDQFSDEDILYESQNSLSQDSLNFSSTSPVKKSRKLSYRDPPPVLQSLDSDAFRCLFESPTLSDSQNSESNFLSSSWKDQRSTANNACAENLSSLGDIIQKYSVANLNSFKGFEIPDPDKLVSPEPRQNETTRSAGELYLLNNNANNNNTASSVIHSETVASVEISHYERGHEVKQTNLMSITLETSDVSEVDVNQTSLLSMPGSGLFTAPSSFERYIDSSAKQNKEKYSQNVNNKTRIKTSDSEPLTEREQSKSKTNEHDLDNLDASEEDEGNDEEDKEDSQHIAPEVFVADLKKYKKCKKNQNHLKFYNIPELQVTHLPAEIRHEDTVAFLSCLSQLVVQITVHSTSSARGPDDMFREYIGTNRMRNGSGFIASVDESIRRYRCRLEDCPHTIHMKDFSSSFEDSGSMASPGFNRSASSVSSSFDRSISNISTISSSSSTSSEGMDLKHFFYGGVFIHTNKHIIFDKSEAENAYIKFFYNTPEGKEVVHGHVAAITGVNNFQDHVVLHVMSHQKKLFTTIDLCLHNAKSSYNQMLQSTSRIQQPLNCKHKHSWVSIISHPHGMAKTVTFGRVVEESAEPTRIVKYYDAPTCPGSSGGLVITPSLLRLQWPGAVHSCTDPSTGYNITYDSRCQDLDHNDMGHIHKNVINRKPSSSEDIFKL